MAWSRIDSLAKRVIRRSERLMRAALLAGEALGELPGAGEAPGQLEGGNEGAQTLSPHLPTNSLDASRRLPATNPTCPAPGTVVGKRLFVVEGHAGSPSASACAF